MQTNIYPALFPLNEGMFMRVGHKLIDQQRKVDRQIRRKNDRLRVDNILNPPAVGLCAG